MNIAFLFPGQGSQYPGMLHQLIDDPLTRETCAEMSEALGFDILTLDSDDSLRSTVAVQLALLAAGVATGRVFLRHGVVPAMVAGMSVGAFAAAVVAEALSLADATRLVKLRSELMETLFPEDFGMAAIVGLNEQAVSRLVQAVTLPEQPVFTANINTPVQIVVSGALAGLRKVVALAPAHGASKAEHLPVSVPSHCSLLEPVATLLNAELGKIELFDPKYPYLSNVRARALRTASALAQDLADNISHPVRWHEITLLARELGADTFLQMPPGHVLNDLAHRSFSETASYAVEASNAAFLLSRLKS